MVATEIRNEIIEEMTQELREREYSFGKQHLKTIVGTCLENKANLIELFSKHPNWKPEKLMIQFDTDIKREICTEEIYYFTKWLRSEVGGEYNFYAEDQSREWLICNFIGAIETQFFSKNMKKDIDEINKLNENYKLRTNMKSSKAIGKICREEGWDKLPEYNKRYAALCDCLNPFTVKRHTCISVNPIDYLLMSNGSSWESCHYIGDYESQRGCYSSGSISYMLDNHSFVFYTVDAAYDGNQIEREPKIQRQMFGYNDEVLVQLRLYPQSNDSGAEQVYDNIRAIVQKVIADCLGKANLWIKSKSDVEDVVHHGVGATCYPDWDKYNPGGDHCSVSTHKERADGKANREIVFGAKPICIACGEYHSIADNISCCEHVHYCADCGRRLDEEDIYWVDDEPYCRDCVEWCEECEHWVRANEINRVDGLQVCDSCLDRYYKECTGCGEMHHEDEMTCTDDGYWFCEDCAETDTFVCPECGRRYYNENACYDPETDTDYCISCYHNLLEKRKEEDEMADAV